VSSRPHVVVVGSVNLDLVARAERLPLPGETLPDAEFHRYPGGKGANQAVAAARLGASVTFVGCVGDDAFADEALAGLREAELELALKRVETPTGVALITVAADGETTIVVAPGANGLLGPGDVEVPEADVVLCQLEIPLETVRAAAHEASSFFCLNAAPAREGPLPAADLTIVNRHEREHLPPDRGGLLAVTLGEEGAVLYDDGEEIARAEPPRVEVVDGTAAGDAFCACLVVSRLEGREWDDALRRACAAGALAASRPGAQPSLPTAAEVDAVLA
jgi:ribokinase